MEKTGRVDKKNIEDILAVTPMQEGMLFHYLENPKGSQYVEQLCLSVSGAIDRQRFEQAWNFVIDTNEMLRTAFRWEQVKKPVQVVLKKHTVDLGYFDLSHTPGTGDHEKTKAKHLHEIKTRDRAEAFDLHDVPFRITLCKLEQDKYEIIISNHHILYDGWSNGILLREFLEAYAALSQNKTPVRPVKNKYKNYVKWLHSQDTGKQEAYWKEYLKGFDTRTGVSLKNEKSNRVEGTEDYLLRFTAGTKEKLEGFAAGRKLTLATLFYCAWGILLQKYNNCRDAVFGTAVSGRNANIDHLEHMIGLFINTLPLRVTAGAADNILTLLDNVNRSLQVRDAYTGTSLVNIKKWSEIDAREEMFDSIVVLVNYPLDESLLQAKGPLTIRSFSMKEETGYDVVTAVSTGDTVEVVFTYRKQLFDESMISRMSGHFMSIIQGMITGPGRRIADMEILSEEEKKQLLYDFNDTFKEFPGDKTCPGLFEEQAAQTPDHIAVIFPHHHVTYRHLNEKSNRLARLLRARGVGADTPDNIAAIMMERSPEMAAAILAAWKAGGAYVPIDPGDPGKRIDYMLKDSGAKVLLKSEIRNPKSETNSNVQNINDQNKNLGIAFVLDFENLNFDIVSNFEFRASNLSSANLAYVIYTSGTTGKPKGAMVEHIGMMNHLWAKIDDLKLTGESVVAQNASHTFDISVWQFFSALILGGKTVIYPNRVIFEPRSFLSRLIKDGITILEVVPSYLALLLDALDSGKAAPTLPLSLRYLVVTGEVVKPGLVRQWFETYPGIKMVNAYGPTEASDDITHYLMDKAPDTERIPIGRPIQNLRIYIVDEHMKLCPVGIKGEICVAGVGVGRGYLGDEERTRQVFMEDPFSEKSGIRFYKTGDLGRWLPDGTIDFFGRKDHQVKIRGFRIELGDIESALAAHPGVKEAVVMDREDEQRGRYLCAYVVSRPGKEAGISGLQTYLQERLPGYMVPAYVVRMEKVPLTANGKIDRKALPEPGIDTQSLPEMPYVTAEMLQKQIVKKKSKPQPEEIDSSREKQKPLSEEEREALLYRFNDTDTDYPSDKTFHQLFETQVQKGPGNTAVVYENKRLTYRQLNEKANGWARILRARGVTGDHIVGLMAERSLEMLIGLLAILKAGGAYLPIDPEFPEERITYMLKDSGVNVLLTNLPEEHRFNCQFSIVNDQLSMNDAPNSLSHPTHLTHPTHPTHPTHLIYVIYTSGTTGKPKGVMVEHRAVVNFAFAMIRTLDFREDDSVLSLSTLAWDMIGTEIFPPLIKGMKVVIGNEEEQLHSTATAAVMERENVTIFQVTPANLRAFISGGRGKERLKALRLLLVGADVFPPPLLEQVQALTHAKIYNLYGPTETTTWSTCKDVTTGKSLNIGKPIANTRVYILNGSGDLQPIGESGELCIGGHGVARGYLNNPELTAERFVGHHRSYRSYRSYILYRTGDFARWLPDGSIDFLGRQDHQVQIRGIRVELGEIENHLLSHEAVKEAVVVARENQAGEKELCACLVTDSLSSVSTPALRKFLSRELPLFLMPTYFVRLEKMPLTANGKVNRKLLESLDYKGLTRVAYDAPQGEIEEKLAEKWQEVLGIPRIGADDNFFEIGGDSIKAIQVAARLQQHGLKMEVRDLFLHPSIHQLAPHVGRVKEDTQSREPGAPVQGPVPLTPIQQWFFQNRFTGGHHFNQAVMLYSEEGFAETVIEQVFTGIVTHHDALRMVYKSDDAVQVNRDNRGKLFDLEVVSTGIDAADFIREQANRVQGEIDLSTGPLVKLLLFKTPAGDHLLIVIHHLVVDGVSWRILLEDFAVGYGQVLRGETPRFRQKTDSYKYWAHRLLEYAESKKCLKQLAYWKTIEDTEVPPLPEDHRVEGDKKIFKYLETVRMTLEEEQTSQLLREANRAYGTEINDLLLTALALAFKEWAGMGKIRVLLEGHGREPIIEGIDLNRTVGWFTSQFPVLPDVGQSDDLSYNIKFVKETMKRIPDRGIGYGILRYLTPADKKGGVTLEKNPGVWFNYLGQWDRGTDYPEIFRMSEMPIGDCVGPGSQRHCAFDINGMVENGKLELSFAYNRFQYERASVETLAGSFKSHLTAILSHCVEKEEKELTPSDVGDKDLSIEQLNDIRDMLNL